MTLKKKKLKFKSFEPTLNKSHDYVFVTRAQGKQDPENHIWALLTVALATDLAMALLTGPQCSAGYKNESYK